MHYSTFQFSAPDTYLREANVAFPDGAQYRFVDNGGSQFDPPLGRFDALVRTPEGGYDLTLQHSSSVLHFDPEGLLLSLRDEYGNTQVYEYDQNGRLEVVADQSGSGRYLNVYWGADGRISAVEDSTGRQIEYHYDASGVLESILDPLEREIALSYTPGRFVPLLSGIQDNWGRTVTAVTYDPSDRVMTYSERGEIYSYSYNYLGNPLKTAKSDSQGNTWVFTFNSSGQVVDNLPPAGSGGANRHTDYNADGSIHQEIDEVGVRTLFAYDSQGRVVSVTYDHLGPAAVRYDYDYDPTFSSKVVSITPRNPATGQVDPHWQASRYDYFQAGSPAPGALHHVYRVRTDGVTLDTLDSYTYDEKGRITSATDSGGGRTDYTYDAAGNQVTVTGPANNDQGLRPVTAYEYDALGRVLAMIDPMGSRTTYTYDSVGRVLTMHLPEPYTGSELDFTFTYSYDEFDQQTQLLFRGVTDPNGHASSSGYSVYGELVKSIDALGRITSNGYSNGRLMTMTDANNNVTTYSYDALRRLSLVTFADGAQESFSYWPNGLLKSKTDRKLQTVTLEYDRFNRLTKRTYPDGTFVQRSFVGQRLIQILDTSVNPAETHLLAYDDAYRVVSDTQADRGRIDYTFAAGDRVASYAVQSGPTVQYTYYPDGSLSTIVWSLISGDFEYAYNLRGQYERITFPNGQHRQYTYDDQGRLVELANLRSGEINLARYTYEYDVDNSSGQPLRLGERTSLTADVPALGFSAVRTDYFYDAETQLTRVDYPNVAPYFGEVDQWTYDGIGNRLSSSVDGITQAYSYEKIGANPYNWQRLESDGVYSYSYDANGNVTTKIGPGENYSFSWNADDKMTGIAGTVAANYRYDFEGRRSSKTVSGETTTYLYDGLNLIGEFGESPAHYLYGPGIDEPLAMSRSGSGFYYIVDGLGSVAAISDSTAEVQKSYVLDTWGQTRSQAGTLESPFGYTARESAEAGMLYYRARYLDPSIGRFSQEDPLGFLAGINRYVYVFSSPLSATDPLGLAAAHVCCMGGQLAICGVQGGLDPLRKSCVEEHEKDHIEYIKPRCPGYCEGKEDGTKHFPVNKDEMECLGFRTEYSCLKRKIGSAPAHLREDAMARMAKLKRKGEKKHKCDTSGW